MKEKEFLPLVKERLGISELNPMQKKMLDCSSEGHNIILLSPTGTGKTLAFILPLLKLMKLSTGRVQCVVIAPSRELVIQIANVVRSIAPGFKTVTLYGGHKMEDEENSLKIVPDIIVATPGRLLDHAKRRNVDLLPCRLLVLDEFDKILELGFEEEMSKICKRLKNVSRTILTSATRAETLPDFIRMEGAKTLDFLGSEGKVRNRMRVHRVDSDGKDKLDSLVALLAALEKESAPERTIIFVNYRESAERIARYLSEKNIDCVLYHGALNQIEREKAIAKFNNASRPILIATDLAARGLDIEHVAHIIHYHSPLTIEVWTHRNGRTARIDRDGDIYRLIGPDEDIKEYVDFDDTMHIDPTASPTARSEWETLYIAEGRKEKISRGDIAGFLMKEGGLEPNEVGKIDVMDHYSLVAVARKRAEQVVKKLENAKLKGRKRRLRISD